MVTQRPRALDLFCGAGGAAMGLHRAGYDVVGVDLAPQPRYPFDFVRGDARTFPLEGFDMIWASPPCQRFTSALAISGAAARARHPDYIAETRARLREAGVPWVIENVPGAPLQHGIVLCGLSFGLRVYRHRVFELSHLVLAPAHMRHPPEWVRGRDFFSVVGGRSGGRGFGSLLPRGTREQWSKAMGIDWMTKYELAEAIPPAYSQYIGEQLLPAVLKMCHVEEGE